MGIIDLKDAFCLLVGVSLACLILGARAADVREPLILERTIPLPAVSGRIDHMAVDLRRGRLFLAELGNNTVDVVDIAAGHTVYRIDGLREPQGIGFAPAADVIAVANAGDGSVRLYRGEDFAPAGRVDLGDDADNVRLDPRSGKFLIGYGSGGIATLDPASGSIVARMALPAHPEGFQIDPVGRRVVVNIPSSSQIGVVDLEAGKQSAIWRVPNLASNFPMALDQADSLIAVVYRSPARLVLLDSGTGTVRANLETCGDSDDVFFDTTRHRIYVSCGAGSIEAFRDDGGSYRSIGRIKTKAGARTSLFVPELDRWFVAQRAGLLGSEAALLVFRPNP